VSGTRGVADAAVLGFLLAFGALAGDAIKSFAKRRVGHMSGGKATGIPSGKSWFPFDQIDYIVGALLLSWPVLQPSLALVAAIVVMYFGLHLVATYLGYRLGLKSDPI
jgi:CDP-2,3-bis-(O-geranylgeranyl)-sn-glycerol synthase